MAPLTASKPPTANKLPQFLMKRRMKSHSFEVGVGHVRAGIPLKHANRPKTKNADVVEHSKAFIHVGLLGNGPPDMAGLPFL
jgi:hypothetical protein